MTDPRNRHLNAAFAPKWRDTGEIAAVNPGASGDTNFDPFMGTGWDHWLDSLGASRPGGAKLVGGSRSLARDPGPVGQRLDLAVGGIQGGGYVGDPNAPGRAQLDLELKKRFPGVI